MNQPRWNRDSIPAGIITFLFTDVEGSSRLWEEDAVATARSVEVHDALVRRIVDASGGYIFGWAGDHFRAAFQDAQAAVDAAVSIQNELARTDWRSGPALRYVWDFIEATPHAAATITSEPSPIGRDGSKPVPPVARFSFPAMWLRWLT